MKKFRALVGVMLSCMALAGCGEEVVKMDEKKYMIVEDEKRYNTFLFDVKEETDIVYGQAVDDSGEQQELKLDMYTPEGDNDTSRPAIIFVHGGGFTKGDKGSEGIIKSMAEDFAKMGYVTCNINYRLTTQSAKQGLPMAMEDLTTAINWVQENAIQYGIDGTRIALAGYSAGAVTVTNLVYCNQKKYVFDRESIIGVIDIAGTKLYCGSPKEDNPACFILHGTKDTTDAFSDSEELTKKLEKRKIPVTLYPLEGMNHNLNTRYDELRNQAAMFLYEELTGKKVTVDIAADCSIEYKKVKQRMQNGIVYEVKPVEMVLDGKLDEWKHIEKISLDQLKDAGTELPEKDEFQGTVMLGWNPEKPSCIYIAAEILNEIDQKKPKDDKWYNTDCLEIIFDVSHDNYDEQLLKWVIGAKNQEFSVLATSENTQVSVVRKGDTSTYEICIDLSKIEQELLKDNHIFPFTTDTVLGMSIAYNNSEDGVRKQQIGWTAGGSGERETFGNVKFSF